MPADTIFLDEEGPSAMLFEPDKIAEIFHGMTEENEILAKFIDVANKEYGIDHVLYGFTHSIFTVKRLKVTRAIYFRHNYPSEYVEAVGLDRLLDDDACTEAIIYDHTSILWSSVDALATPAQARRIELDESFGITVGASFALPFDEGRGIGGVGLCTRSRSEADFAREWSLRKAEIEFFVSCFDLAMRGPMVRSLFRLTPRERDVLAYTAGGLSAKEIAHHLGIGAKSVSNTLERARRSMDAKTTAEAVAKAHVYRLI